MAIAATALLIAGLVLPIFERRRGARAIQPRRAEVISAPVPSAPPVTGYPAAGPGAGPGAGAPLAVGRATTPPLNPTLVQPSPTGPPIVNPSSVNTAPTSGTNPTQIQQPPQERSVLWDNPPPSDKTRPMPSPTWTEPNKT